MTFGPGTREWGLSQRAEAVGGKLMEGDWVRGVVISRGWTLRFPDVYLVGMEDLDAVEKQIASRERDAAAVRRRR